MAFGFIKKVFSFGRDKVEETPAEAPAVESAVAPESAAPDGSNEIAPPLREPSPVHADPLRDEIAPEMEAIPQPDETSTAAEPAALPADAQVASGSVADAAAPVGEAEPHLAEAPPAAEIEPPLRAPPPVAPDPILAEIAPEPEAPPAPASTGRITVGKAVERKAEEAIPVVSQPVPRQSWFQKLREGLSRSSRELSGSIAGVFTKRKLDEDTLQDLEDVLIRADLGMETAMRVTDALASGRYGKDVSDLDVRTIMAQEVEKVLKPVALPLELDLSVKPHVILVVGVNGTGKTTTIGKLAAKLTAGGLKVMLAAGDTFRAAAIEQLKIWGERTGSPVVASRLGADAAGLAYEAFEKAREAGSDVLIIDTAGRLQNKAELMAELEKVVRVLGKLDPDAPHTVLQTVDATTGQNALNQVEIFRNVAGVNGLVMTKLDGTARGGILVAIAAKHKLPVYFIGVGEQVDDLEPFSASDFAKAIAGVG
ncbi:MAG: signal recognition particle-docking protein FtsY [Mesorhizobium sp.]